jgi:hypothetical protein
MWEYVKKSEALVMNFNVDRIAQLAGLAGSASGSGAPRALTESARPARAPTTYDRVVEELQTRGLEMFYTPEQINEAIRSERRMLMEERAMEDEGVCPKCGKKHCVCESADEGMGYEEEDEGYDLDEAEQLLDKEADEGMDDLEVGTTIKTPKGRTRPTTSIRASLAT